MTTRGASWCLLFLGLAAPYCAGAATLTLAGTVGKSAVVVEFDLDASGTGEGRYFYRKHHRDLVLYVATASDGTLVLDERPGGDGAATATMLLKPGADGAWRGSWESRRGGGLLPVALSVLPEKEGGAAINVYDRERLRDLPLQREATAMVDGHQLQWWLEPVSGVRVFRLAGGYPAKTLALVNARLAAEQTQAIAGSFACRLDHARSFGPEETDYSFTATPRLLSATLLSVTFSTVGNCGASLVAVTGSEMNVHVPSMRQLALSDMLSGRGELGTWLASALRQRDPVRMADLEENCHPDDGAVWGSAHWFMTHEGLSVEPAFSQSKQGPCGGEWLLPWSFVKQHRGKYGAGA